MKTKLIFLLLFLSFSVVGQRVSEGENLFNSKQYLKARAVYETLLKQKPNDPLYNFRFARCCYELKEYELAIEHFNMSGNKFPTRDLYLGELYFKSYRFDESVMAYQSYIATLLPDDSKLPEYQRKVAQAEHAARLINKVESIALIDSQLVDKNDFLRFYKFSSELGSLNQESMKLKSRRNTDKIKYTTQRQDRVYYSDSIQGQLDIFTSFKLLDEWSAPVSISSVINTSANENYPFLLLDGVTIYFASDGENSIGGYDIFITRFTPATNTYLAPENIGFPFNSLSNDYMMVIDEQRKLGWFATDRNQSSGKVMIYSFVPNDTKMIVRTEDKDYLRSVAQLKLYRTTTVNLANNKADTQIELRDNNQQIEFIVNDSLIYTHLSDFKSVEALKGWSEMYKLTSELKTKKNQLDNLRQQYSQIENSLDRITIALKIVDFEKKNNEMEKLLSEKIIQVRNLEILFLQKSH
ncbi:MAG: hypothetical protein ACOYMD_09760 [Paludibacter sp.]